MGQIFSAIVYDTEDMVCSVEYADKFPANCYSFSTVVCIAHYLLRQRPYRVLWGGDYVTIDDNLKYFKTKEELLGISTYTNLDSFKRDDEDLKNKDYYEDLKFIDEASKKWTRIDVEREAERYFNFDKTHSVMYSGYLINHTKKQAINLEDYYKRSVMLTSQSHEEYVIDLIPVLTETGGGTPMVLFEGRSLDTTSKFSKWWRADLLQISESIPYGYSLISCCFAELFGKAIYFENKFGMNKDGLILCNENGNLFEAEKILYKGTVHVKVVDKDGEKSYKVVGDSDRVVL